MVYFALKEDYSSLVAVFGWLLRKSRCSDGVLEEKEVLALRIKKIEAEVEVVLAEKYPRNPTRQLTRRVSQLASQLGELVSESCKVQTNFSWTFSEVQLAKQLGEFLSELPNSPANSASWPANLRICSVFGGYKTSFITLFHPCFSYTTLDQRIWSFLESSWCLKTIS